MLENLIMDMKNNNVLVDNSVLYHKASQSPTNFIVEEKWYADVVDRLWTFQWAYFETWTLWTI